MRRRRRHGIVVVASVVVVQASFDGTTELRRLDMVNMSRYLNGMCPC